MDRAAILLLAQAFDALVGDPQGLWARVPHPVALAGRLIGALDGHWNRETDAPSTRRGWGALALFVVLLASAGIGAVAAILFSSLGVAGIVAEIAVVGVLLAQRSLYDHVIAVADALLAGGLEAGRAAVSRIVGRDPASLDEPAVCRAAIESAAENFSDGVVAPAFWYLVGGLPGLLAYKALNTADSMIGHRSDRHLHFGWATARLDDLANWLPARLSAALVAAVAWSTQDGDSAAAWRRPLADASRHRSVNAGWPEAAFAGALGLRLAGPRHYGGKTVDDAWMGDGRAEATQEDVRRAAGLLTRSCAALAGISALLYLVG